VVAAGIYVRVSTDRQEDGYSPEVQLQACRDYVTRQGYTLDPAHVFHETHTGSELRQREELGRLRALVAEKVIQRPVAYCLDRLSRSQVHVAILVDEAQDAGAHWEFATETYEDSALGRFIMAAKAFVAELEREKIRERTMGGRRARVAAGKPLPGCRAPYGYRWADAEKSVLAIDGESAATVRRIFAALVEGVPLRRLAEELNEGGVPTPSGRGTGWRASTIRCIVSNPVYTGQQVALRWARGGADGQVVLSTPVEPLVTVEQAQAVLRQLTINQQTATRNCKEPEAVLLRGGFVRCGVCGKSMVARRHHNREGRTWYTYQCQTLTYDRPTCHGNEIVAAQVDGEAWSRIKAAANDPDTFLQQLAERQDDDPTAGPLLQVERQLEKTQKETERLAHALTRFEDETAVAPVVAELQRLSKLKESLTNERQGLLAQRVLWERGRSQQHELRELLSHLGPVVDNMPYSLRRQAVLDLGLQARVYPAGHEPRLEILGGAAVVNTTSSGPVRNVMPFQFL
jgi:site-specific DNA recombinase